MKGKYQIVLLALFAMTLLIVPTAARAGTNLGMQLSSTPDSFTLCDNNVNFTGCTSNTSDLNPGAGAITFIGAVGGWNSNVTSGFGPPSLNLPELMDLNNISLSTNGASPLTLTLTLTGLTGPLGNLQFLNAIGGTNSGANVDVTVGAWLSQSNTAFCTNGGCGTQFISQSFHTSGGTNWGGTALGSANTGAGPYSVTLAITIDSHGGSDTTSFDDELFIPEPATLSVLGAGLLALGTGLRKKLLRA
jgi:hypothetical protein